MKTNERFIVLPMVKQLLIYYIYDESQNKYIEANLEGYLIKLDSENKIATSKKTCGDVFVDPMFIKLYKRYLFNKNKKYDYQDQYCISYENYEEKSIDKKYTKKKDWIAKKLQQRLAMSFKTNN